MVVQAYVEHRPELIDVVFSPSCGPGCLRAETKQVIKEMTAADARIEGYGPDAIAVDLIDDKEAGRTLEGRTVRAVTLRVVDEQAPYRFVRRDGSVIEQAPGWGPRASVYFLYFSAETGQWRIFDRLVEGTAEDVLGPDWQSELSER